MIEWLFLGIGAAVVGGAFGSSSRSKTTSYNPSNANVASPPEKAKKIAILSDGDDEQKTAIHQWRAQWEPIIDRSKWIAQSTATHIISRFPCPIIKQIPQSDVEIQLKAELLAEFADHNLEFIKSQKRQLEAFFKTIEDSPLTEEQMEACICMDDAVQVVAAAGSGKTSSIVARLGYILHRGLAAPEEILILSFNRAVADELQNRINIKLTAFDGISDIKVKTFNAFGLEIIGQATGKKPSIPSWLDQSTSNGANIIVKIIERLKKNDKKFHDDWNLFQTVFGRDIGHFETTRSQKSIFTANGEKVKSNEEQMIANWLFFHHIQYNYERAYKHETKTATHGQYKPDFYYPDIELYHEHFALDKDGSPPPQFGKRYLAGVDWKRQLHAEKGTDFIETTSAQLRSVGGFEKLKEELQAYGITPHFDPHRPVKGQKPLTILQLARLIRTFQQHAKSNEFSVKKLIEMQKLHGDYNQRFCLFIELYDKIAKAWEQLLKEENAIDFEDMIAFAAKIIEDDKFHSPYKMILVDEFQDISQSKVRLLKALLKNGGDKTTLFVVGDDWQGINHFAGSDISVMTEFSKIFEHSTQLMLNTTFRCPQSLCDVSSKFILENQKQIKKTVITANKYQKDTLFAYVFISQEKAHLKLEQDLKDMYHYAADGKLIGHDDKPITILLLGRYNDDIPPNLSRWQHNFKKYLKIEFKTIHKAKGLEADYVMIVNVVDDYRGFPSQILSDTLLQTVMPDPDPFPDAEERRLFYVALTRARRQVRIYSLKKNPSRFILELEKYGALTITAPDM